MLLFDSDSVSMCTIGMLRLDACVCVRIKMVSDVSIGVLDVHYVSMIGYRYFNPNLNCLETNEQQQNRRRFRHRSAQ